MSRSPKTHDEPLPDLAATVVGQKFPVMPPATPPAPKPPPPSPSTTDNFAPPASPAAPAARVSATPATTPTTATTATTATAPPARKNTTLFIILGLVAVILVGAILMLVALFLFTR